MELLEKDMEDLIIENPQKYLNEPDLKLVSRQYTIGKYRFDLLFQDRHNGKIIVEIQRGTLDRNHTYKILDYFDEYKKRNPSSFIDLIIVSNKITRERRDRLNSYGISFFEIAESIFLADPNLVIRKENQKRDSIPHVSESIGENVLFNPKIIKKDSSKIPSKIKSIFAKQTNEILKSREIIDKVIELYPETNRASVIPSDYCYNIINKAAFSFTTHLFEYFEGNYICLGENYPYVGDIYWKNQKIGSWEKGKPVLITDPRK
jgi:hypothetical protein